MNTKFVIRLDTNVEMTNGQHPVYVQVTFNSTSRKKRIKGYTCKREHWDFDKHQYNVHEKGFEKKNESIFAYLDKCKRVYENNFFDDFSYKSFVRLLNEEKKKVVDDKRLYDFCKEFYKEKIADGKVASAQNYIRLIFVFEEARLNNIRLRDFDISCLKKIVKSFDEREIRGYNYLKYLKILYNVAVKRKYVESKYNPFKSQANPDGYNIEKRKNTPSKRINKKRIKDLTEEEKDMIMNYYYNHTFSPIEKKRLAYWVLSYMFFGVNFVDLAVLEWSDINNDIWNYARSKTGFENKLGKPVKEAAMEILKEYDSGKKYILDIIDGNEKDPIILHKKLSDERNSCRQTYRRISKKIGFTDDRYFTFYSGRYTAPTLALSKGIDINTVRTLMDHASISTTNKYLGMVRDKEKLKAAMDIL